MNTLLFDTETNGLPRGPTVADQPDMLQLAAILLEGTRPVGHLSCFCNPEHHDAQLKIPHERFFKDAGLTHERVREMGLPYRTALAIFNNFLRRADRLVAHNIPFDAGVVHAAYHRIGGDLEKWNKTPKFCTMMTLTPILKIEWPSGRRRRGDHKWPSLQEAYKAMVDPDGFAGAHDAMVDCTALARILQATEACGHALWELKE